MKYHEDVSSRSLVGMRYSGSTVKPSFVKPVLKKCYRSHDTTES